MNFRSFRAWRMGLLGKLLAVGVFAALLVLVLQLISDLIDERQRFGKQVAAEIAASWTGPQKIMGPILVAPYKITRNVRKRVQQKGRQVTKRVKEVSEHVKYFLPGKLSAKADLNTQFRYRGIYRVPVYLSDVSVSAEFDLSREIEQDTQKAKVEWGRPYLVVAVQDIRGFSTSPQIKVEGASLEILPGTKVKFLGQGFHGFLDAMPKEPKRIKANLSLGLQGMESLSFLPAGKSSKVRLSSPWPHPSFFGRFLPKDRKVSQDGFEASWETSFLSSNMHRLFEDCVRKRKCSAFENNSFGVTLLSGVDVYLQSERAIKYALLFIGLTFAVFFLFEVLKELRIHPIQYGLVGIALVLFYLLLLSLSEHIDFAWAYILASLACTGLIGFYVSHVLQSARRGFAFGFGLAGLYGALHVLISSEDYALVMGAALLFLILAMVMIITRKVDWHALGQSAEETPGQVIDGEAVT